MGRHSTFHKVIRLLFISQEYSGSTLNIQDSFSGNVFIQNDVIFEKDDVILIKDDAILIKDDAIQLDKKG